MQMPRLPPVEEMYRALVDRDSSYEGIFVVGIVTTGILCRPTCSARKPKAENVRYFASLSEGLLAGFRPCKRCRPLESEGTTPAWLRPLLDAIEAEPDRRWRDADLRERGLEPARVRRWFHRHHGMTFHAYHRARRLGTALGRIHAGDDLTGTAFEAGYESSSAFRDAFAKLFGDPPGRAKATTRVLVERLTTPLGTMLAAATDDALCLLEFADRRMLETQISRLRRQLCAAFVPGHNDVLGEARVQIEEYFAGRRRTFDLPIATPGTEFQRAVWQILRDIPYGETRSYAQQALAIGRPESVRAVGRDNGDNRIAIVIPCHRVVGVNGELTGYGGHLWRKKALLALERDQRGLVELPHDR